DAPITAFVQDYFEEAGTGYPVHVTYGDYSNYATQSAEIDAADIFMVGRNLSSAAFDNAANSASFNALAKPVVCFTSYVARTLDSGGGGRWSWHSGSTSATLPPGVLDETTVTTAGAAVFGIPNGSHDFLKDADGTVDATGVGTVGTGDILATVGGDILAAAWDTGETSAGGANFGGPRLLWNISDESGGAHLPTIVGQKALANALAATTSLVVKDTDSDGLPDYYEQAIIDFNGGDAVTDFTHVTPTTDFDGDGVNDGDEFANNTDPTVVPPTGLVVLMSGTNQTADQPLIDFIKNNFQNVSVTYGDFSNYAAASAGIEAADVFMVGRNLSSAPYANQTNSDSFNALNVPIVCFTSYVARTLDGRWGWHSGSTSAGSPYIGDDTTVTAAGATAFGVATGTYDWMTNTGDNLFNATGIGTVGGGEILATLGGNILAAHWAPGALLSDGITTAGEHRLLYNLEEGAVLLPTIKGRMALISALEAYTPLVAVNQDTDADGLPDVYEQMIIDANSVDGVTDLIHVSPITDFDADGVNDGDEYANDSSPLLADTDGDGISDANELAGNDAAGSPTGFGPTRPNNADTDGDGISDPNEIAGNDADGVSTGFGPTNPNSADSDSDTIPDDYEIANNLNPNDNTGDNGSTGDPDTDGLDNAGEFANNTNPNLADTDADGLNDGPEVDGSLNAYDEFGALVGAGNGGASSNPLDSDSDDDGILDGEEINEGVDGYVTDPNSDDSDGDFLGDTWEIDNSLDPTDPTGDNGDFGDPDSDGLDNFGEQAEGTDPQNPDTDADGLNDGPEYDGTDNSGVDYGFGFTDPLDEDSDNDGILDGEEMVLGTDGFITNPNSADTDSDGFSDDFEIAQGTDPTDALSSPAGLIHPTNSLMGSTAVGATADGAGVLFTSTSFDMTGGNAVALMVTTEGVVDDAAFTGWSATFAGQPMEVHSINQGINSSTIFYLIDPVTTVGSFELNVGAGVTGDYVYSMIALDNVPGVAATPSIASTSSTSSTGTTPLELSYETGGDNGYVIAAAVNNDFDGNATPLSVAYGNPDTPLLSPSYFTQGNSNGHFHVSGRVFPAGSYTDGYYGQYQRTAIASVVFGEPVVAGFSAWSTTNTGGQTANEDNNNDGVQNGIAYFLNDTGAIVLPGLVNGSITFVNGGNIPASEYGTQFWLATSPDLQVWTPVPVGNLDLNENGPGGSLKYTLPTGSPKLFVRMVVVPN
ncbi:MAG: hypothetical protein KDN05_00005, partial [Verrucomicrobiae bacterium]|nr:hypothetical protein [Verrucomicrobiae bacterium]